MKVCAREGGDRGRGTGWGQMIKGLVQHEEFVLHPTGSEWRWEGSRQ